MNIFLELTVIASFWASIIIPWIIISYEMTPEHAPAWWLHARERWWGGVIFIVCVLGVVAPMIILFSLPE